MKACYAGDTINMWKLQTTYADFGNSGMTSEARAGLDPETEEYQLRYARLSSTFMDPRPPETFYPG